jgi:hypothetical protein
MASTTYRSGGQLHRLRHKEKSLGDWDADEALRKARAAGKAATPGDYSDENVALSTSDRVMERAGGSEALFSGNLDTNMEESTMKQVTNRAYGSEQPMMKIEQSQQANAGQPVGGTYTPSVEQTSMGEQSAALGGAEAMMGGSGGNAQMGGIMQAIGGQIGSKDDKKDEQAKRLLYDNSDLAAMRGLRPEGPDMDVQALLEKARRFGGKK